jgi:hypothetical protein
MFKRELIEKRYGLLADLRCLVRNPIALKAPKSFSVSQPTINLTGTPLATFLAYDQTG